MRRSSIEGTFAIVKSEGARRAVVEGVSESGVHRRGPGDRGPSGGVRRRRARGRTRAEHPSGSGEGGRAQTRVAWMGRRA